MHLERIKFNNRKEVETYLANYPDIYAIDSLVKNGLSYGVSDGYFAIFTAYDISRVPFDETMELAGLMIPEVREEITAIYDDTKFMRIS